MIIETLLISILILQIVSLVFAVKRQLYFRDSLVPIFTNAVTSVSDSVSEQFNKNMKKTSKDLQMFLARSSPGGSHSPAPTPSGQGKAALAGGGGGDIIQQGIAFVLSPEGQTLIKGFMGKP